MALTQRADLNTERTWTVLDGDFAIVEPVEAFLEHLRSQEFSPNTIKSYARGLALWWTFLEMFQLAWDGVEPRDVSTFVRLVRTRSIESGVEPLRADVRASDATVAARVRAVLSFYKYQAAHGATAGSSLYEVVRGRPARHLLFLEHVARRRGRRRLLVRVPQARAAGGRLPLVSPAYLAAMCDLEATWDPVAGSYQGDVRYRMLWSVLAETGMRLGEALSLQHQDWKMWDN